MNEKNTSFLKNHADTLAIIGVNIAIAAILISLHLSNVSRIDASNAVRDASFSAANARMDSMHVMIYEQMKDFHGRLCAIEERNRGK